jgi:hypothetical protein
VISALAAFRRVERVTAQGSDFRSARNDARALATTGAHLVALADRGLTLDDVAALYRHAPKMASRPLGGAFGAPGRRACHMVRGSYASKLTLAGQANTRTKERRGCGLDKRSFHISQLLRDVFANTVLQVRSVLELPHAGHAAADADSDIGRATSNVLWQSRHLNS